MSTAREIGKDILRRRIQQLAEDAGQRHAALPDEVLDYLERPSSGMVLAVLDAYLFGVTGLPLRVSVRQPAHAPAIPPQSPNSTPFGDSTDHAQSSHADASNRP